MTNPLEVEARAAAKARLDTNAEAFGILTSLVPAVASALETALAQLWLEGYNKCLIDRASDLKT